nr:2Fe-2S iron-sulfur cluster-binding protein [Kangiella sp. TOML190]
MLTIEINGQKVEAEEGAMIIEVADAHGYEIPRFCYHKKAFGGGQLPYVFGRSGRPKKAVARLRHASFRWHDH